jgi:LEA14-like dessication related protein
MGIHSGNNRIQQIHGPHGIVQPQLAGLLPLLGFLLFLALSISSCVTLREPDFRAVENIRVARLGKNETTLAMDVRYYNPNKTRVKLKEAGGSAWLEGNFLGNFKMDSMVHIPAYAEFTLPVTLDVDMKMLLRNSLSAFLNKEVIIKLEGKAKLGKGFVYINYPIRYEGKQEVEKLLR